MSGSITTHLAYTSTCMEMLTSFVFLPAEKEGPHPIIADQGFAQTTTLQPSILCEALALLVFLQHGMGM